YLCLTPRPPHELAPLSLHDALPIFGDQLALLGIPAEVYTEQGMAIRRQSRYAHTLPVCYANGLYGYLPPREEFVKGGYTAKLAAAVYDTPPYVSVVAERLVSAAATLLH